MRSPGIVVILVNHSPFPWIGVGPRVCHFVCPACVRTGTLVEYFPLQSTYGVYRSWIQDTKLRGGKTKFDMLMEMDARESPWNLRGWLVESFPWVNCTRPGSKLCSVHSGGGPCHWCVLVCVPRSTPFSCLSAVLGSTSADGVDEYLLSPEWQVLVYSGVFPREYLFMQWWKSMWKHFILYMNIRYKIFVSL